jgi:hypothetical protein
MYFTSLFRFVNEYEEHFYGQEAEFLLKLENGIFMNINLGRGMNTRIGHILQHNGLHVLIKVTVQL